METSKTNPGSSYFLQKRTILIFIVSISLCVFFLFARGIPSRIASGNRGRIAIKILDEVRRPFLDIHKVESSLLRDDHSKTIHESFEQGINRGLRLIADFKTVSTYNRELLDRVEKLSSTFEGWIKAERALFDLLAGNSSTGIGLMSNVENYQIIVKSATYFTLTMDLLGDAEIPIHNDIHEGSKAVTEILIIGGIFLVGLVGMVFCLPCFKNKKLRELLIVNKQTEEKITSMANILEESLNEIYIFDSKTLHFIKVNKGGRLNLGYSMEELSSLTPIDLKPGFTYESFEKLIEPLRTGKKEKIEYTTVHRRKDGSLYDAEIHLQLSIFQFIPVFVAIILDVTERKKSEERLQAIIDNSTAVIYLKDIRGYYIIVNELFESLFNISRKEIVDKTDYDVFPTKIAEAFQKNDRKVLERRKPIEFEEVASHEDGLHTYISLKFPLSNTEGVIYGICGISTDITERKQAEEKIKQLNETLEQRVLERTEELSKVNKKIKEREAKLLGILSSLYEAAIVVYDRDGIIMSLWGTPEMDNRYGVRAVDAVGRSIREFTSPEQAEKLIAQIHHIMDTGTKVIHEYMITVPGGKFWEETSLCPMHNAEGNIISVVGFVRDVTEQKRAEDNLHKKNSYLKLLKVAAVASNEAEDIKDAFLPILAQICNYSGWEIGHAYAISEDNPDLLKPTEVWCLEEQKQFQDFCSVTKQTDFTRGVGLPGRVLASCKPHWIADVTKDNNFLRKKVAKVLNIKSGIAFPVMVGEHVVAVLEFFTTMELESDQQFMDIMADVGTQLGRVVERKQSKYVLEMNYQTQKILNDLLRISHEENTLMELLEHSIDIILCIPWLKSKMGGIFMVESEPEVLVLKVKRNLPKGLLEVCNRVPFGMCLCGDAALSGKILHSDNIDDKHIILYKDIEPHGHYNIPILLNGKTIGLILLYLEAGHSRDEKEIMFLETLTNTLSGIIKRKKMEEALVQSEKMKAMGIMTSGVAHEFNNILAVISSNAQFLEETNRSNKDLMKALRTICRMADDGAEIVNRMYEFTNVRRDMSRYINVDLNDLIEQVIGFTMPRWKEMAQARGIKYRIVRKSIKKVPSVLGNPSEMREVFLNIVNNALDAMPNGGTISVDIKFFQGAHISRVHNSTNYFDESRGKLGVNMRKEEVTKFVTHDSKCKIDFVEISFTDDGKGMTEEVKRMMFDPYFTTRSPQGTGLGMSVSYGIITRHGGEISVESEQGKGTKINLRLPISDKSSRKFVKTRYDEELDINSINILVVDDKIEICESLSKLFLEAGHKVCSVNNGTEAIKLLKKNNYDLLICDLVMPDVNGRDILNAIKTMNKRPKVGLITGWRYNIDDAKKDGLEVDFIVKKPFDLSKLRRDINDLWR